jgi:hypothetical protein
VLRHSQLEDLHAGFTPSSATADYADVTVTSPFGSMPWPGVSRFNDEEMKQLTIDVVDRTYQFLHTLFEDHTGGALLGWLAEHDPAPKWTAPRILRRRDHQRRERNDQPRFTIARFQ